VLCILRLLWTSCYRYLVCVAVVRSGILIHKAVGVVNAMAADLEAALTAMSPYGLLVQPEPGGDLIEGQESRSAEPLFAAGQPVGTAHDVDAPCIEALPGAGHETPFIQDRCRLGVGVIVQESIDLVHDLPGQLMLFPGRSGSRQRDGSACSSPEPDVRADLSVRITDECDVLNEEP